VALLLQSLLSQGDSLRMDVLDRRNVVNADLMHKHHLIDNGVLLFEKQ
jgi:hypothetical protein